MEKRILGKSNLEVSVIGLGGIPIQKAKSEEEAYNLVLDAYNNGINFIDTARGYRNSESLIGYAVEKIGRDKFIIATKSGQKTYGEIKEEIDISLNNLRTDYIDLFQFHNVRTKEELDLILSDNGALKLVKEYKEKGLIRQIGITSHSADLLDIAIDTNEFTTIQFPYNPVELQGEEVFKKAKKNNLGVIIMKPLAGGAITKGDLSLRFILENENVTSVIPGMGSREEIEENTSVGKDLRGLTDEEREILNEEVSSLGIHFCRRCGYCLPCTVGIDIPTQFVIDAYYTRYNLPDWAIDRYRKLDIKAKDCIECGKCLDRCPYDLPIIDMLKDVEEHLGK